MKKIALFSSIFFLTFQLFSQVEVGTNNKVSIGPYSPSTVDLNTGSAQFNSTVKIVGNLGIGITPTTYQLDFADGVSIARFPTSLYDVIIDNTGYYGIDIYPTSDGKCTIGKSGLRFYAMYAQSFLTTSDERLKENIRSLTGGLNQILLLKPVIYDFKKEYAYPSVTEKNQKVIDNVEKNRKDNIGFLAQDLQKVIPEAVEYTDSTDSYNVNYIALIPVLVRAIQEQNAKIASLEAQVKALSIKK
jgi:hypothetical protein